MQKNIFQLFFSLDSGFTKEMAPINFFFKKIKFFAPFFVLQVY